jgi:eukaryotic-like serine/threonine-protein kinase
MIDTERTGVYDSGGLDDAATGVVLQPEHIGRYRVEKILGQGGFGIVYLAHDGQLQRFVAIKVPHRHRVSGAEDAEAYLTEARTVASLDHPNIVPVHDVGSTDDYPCFVVSKFIEGCTLSQKIRDDRPTIGEAAELVATIAEALHYAHRRGLVHRDIKPSNILLDASGKPFVVDFGLALKEENIGHGPKHAGTPSYMSPEQARGEGHRVDGRSDIFSLGVVFYELLVGRQPFRADSQVELMEQVATFEPRPPRQYDENIPKELERICFKALAKRASERYLTAKDMADDLRHFWTEQTVNQQWSSQARSISSLSTTLVQQPPSTAMASGRSGSPGTTVPGLATTPTSDHQPIKIVPKGLRSFDAHDADFFLELLPGPRDRDGLPDSLRFWKTRIEEKDADNTFTVGLIYGPSGCGKSSLVKAGLLPRLSDDTIAVYVEATALETETRLLNGLRKRCPALADNLPLKETLAALRRGQGIPQGKKVLIVLDQFEQWLHARKEEQNTELVQALRQCDGSRVQCIVMVRDDFWLSVSRFLRELEIRLLEGQNSALADLFDADHARKVLAAFGRAFGKLPGNSAESSKDQKEFLKQAVSGLAQEGKVVCVRLALFAEMMKGKSWSSAALKEVGGTEGVGVTFLEETFSAATAPPEHRYHQRAARGVLKALLPESGTDIKGHMRSDRELLEASGYAGRPRDFDELIRILDSEIRLITPIDPEGIEVAPEAHGRPSVGLRYYQLTHDYLVPSLRNWLTRKQKETRRGRAELMLADRTAVWYARPERRQLPSVREWAYIRMFGSRRNWTEPQRKMMRSASRHLATKWGLALTGFLILIVSAAVVRKIQERETKAGTVRFLVEKSLPAAPISNVAGLSIVLRQDGYKEHAIPLLRQACADAEAKNDHARRLRCSLVLLPDDRGQVDYLSERLLEGEPQEVVVIREALLGHKAELTERFWNVLVNPANEPGQRFRAACALSAFAPDDPRWEKAAGDVAATLVIQKPFVLVQWTDALKGVGRWLIAPLADFLVDENRSVAERGLITSIYGNFAGDIPEAIVRLEKRLGEQTEANAPIEARIALAKRQASIGMALMLMGRDEKVWPLLKQSPHPTSRSFLIERLGPGGLDAKVLTAGLEEQETSVKRAILLSLGEYGLDHLSQFERRNHVSRLLQLYRDDVDPGIHAAAEWLLRQWQASDEIKEIDKELATGKLEGKRQWYLNRQGQTLMISKPGEFWMGEEDGRYQMRIGRSIAVASKEVTLDQYLRFRKDHHFIKDYAPSGDCPVNQVNWYDAVAYCNWLSEQEGIPKEQWCYVANMEGKYADGMTMAPDYLRRTGYRLPTEPEWEYCCRAGADTVFAFGESQDLLGKYAWFGANSLNKSHPVGTLRPNDLGLFDMHGNAHEWCQDVYKAHGNSRAGKTTDDVEGVTEAKNSDHRVVRGGSFVVQPGYARTALRFFNVPSQRDDSDGFRVVRTHAP